MARAPARRNWSAIENDGRRAMARYSLPAHPSDLNDKPVFIANCMHASSNNPVRSTSYGQDHPEPMNSGHSLTCVSFVSFTARPDLFGLHPIGETTEWQ